MYIVEWVGNLIISAPRLYLRFRYRDRSKVKLIACLRNGNGPFNPFASSTDLSSIDL